MAQHILHVQGMHCAHCERAITSAVQALDTQAQLVIDRASAQVQIHSQASHSDLVAAIAQAGYTVD